MEARGPRAFGKAAEAATAEAATADEEEQRGDINRLN